jgi:hypothetical protein
MLQLLGVNARATGTPHEFRVIVPTDLRGPGVEDRYPLVTFRRSVALTLGMESTEFAHRLHPLVRAAAAGAREQLRSTAPSIAASPCLAVRRCAAIGDSPAIVFTYLDHETHGDGALVAVGVTLDGGEIQEAQLSAALSADPRPGDVPWTECERVFAARFASLRLQAAKCVLAHLRTRAAIERDRRNGVAAHLRAEIDAYRSDRSLEIDREEAEERAGTRDQTDLFRETRTDWAARRAAVLTQAVTRLAQIAEWETVPDPVEPTPLGVLLLLPSERS